MALLSRWKRWFGPKKTAPSPAEPELVLLRKAYVKQRRRWDYAVTLCSLLTLVTGALRPLTGLVLLPLAATVFAIYQYRKCSRFGRTVSEIEVLQRWLDRVQAEAKKEEAQRREEERRRQEE